VGLGLEGLQWKEIKGGLMLSARVRNCVVVSCGEGNISAVWEGRGEVGGFWSISGGMWRDIASFAF